MRVSKDRSTWVSLGDWVDDRSIFAMNSEVHKFTDTQKTISKSGYKIVTDVQRSESRVLNVSGMIIGASSEDCREKSIEIRELLIGNSLYFHEEYYNRVVHGSVSNINDSVKRGAFLGKVNLINFNISCLDPYWQTLTKYSIDFDAGDPISIDYSDNGAVNTDYTIELTCLTATTPVTSLVSGLIELSSELTLNAGDKLKFSSEGSSFLASSTIAGVTVNRLGLLSDAFFINGLVLTPGVNTITINPLIDEDFDVNVSFYGRSI